MFQILGFGWQVSVPPLAAEAANLIGKEIKVLFEIC
jgi:hypothetical protein